MVFHVTPRLRRPRGAVGPSSSAEPSVPPLPSAPGAGLPSEPPALLPASASGPSCHLLAFLLRSHAFSVNVCPLCTKPYFFKKCVPLWHETILFQELRAPLARNHTCSINARPSCTKPHFFNKCVPLLHETTLFCKNTESRTRGYVNNSRNLPTSRTQRTQGRNIPFEGTPHSDNSIC